MLNGSVMNAPQKKPYSVTKIIRPALLSMPIHAKDRAARRKQVGMNIFMGPVLFAAYY
jgi:hypothetical protein